jgi:Holliday junction resolvasome RuvABC endonuclease subunit
MNVLGVDPGYANFGWTLASVVGQRIDPLCVGVVLTEKSHRRNKVLAPDDEFRRTKELHAALMALVHRNDVKLICAEGMSSPRNAKTIRMLGFAWGVLASICSELEIPMVQISPNMLKKKLCGKVNSTDRELHEEITDRYPVMATLIESVTVKSKREHAYDAMIAIEVCKNSEVFVMLKGVS